MNMNSPRHRTPVGGAGGRVPESPLTSNCNVAISSLEPLFGAPFPVLSNFNIKKTKNASSNN